MNRANTRLNKVFIASIANLKTPVIFFRTMPSKNIFLFPLIVEKIASELSGADLLSFCFVFFQLLPPYKWERLFFSDGNYELTGKKAWFKTRYDLAPRSSEKEWFLSKALEHSQVLKSRGSKKSDARGCFVSDKLEIPIHDSADEEHNLRNASFLTSFFSGYNVPRPFKNLLVVAGTKGVQILGCVNGQLNTVKFFPIQRPSDVKMSRHRNMLCWRERGRSFILTPVMSDSGPSFRLDKFNCWCEDEFMPYYFDHFAFQDGSFISVTRRDYCLFKPRTEGYKLVPLLDGRGILSSDPRNCSGFMSTKINGEYFVILKRQSYESELIYDETHLRRPDCLPPKYIVPHADSYRLKEEDNRLKFEKSLGTHRRIFAFKDHYIHNIQLNVTGDKIFLLTCYR